MSVEMHSLDNPERSPDDAIALDGLVESAAIPPAPPRSEWGQNPDPDSVYPDYDSLVSGSVTIPAGEVGPVLVANRNECRKRLVIRCSAPSAPIALPILADDRSKAQSTMVGYPMLMDNELYLGGHTGAVWVGLSAPESIAVTVSFVSVV